MFLKILFLHKYLIVVIISLSTLNNILFSMHLKFEYLKILIIKI